MASRISAVPLVALVLLALSACSGGGDGGAIDMAVSEMCTDGADSECVSVNGESIVAPSGYEPASVERAAVAESEGTNAVDVTFDAEGAEVFHALAAEAAQAGDTARLVMKFGEKKLVALTVKDAIDRDQMQIALSPDESAQELLDLIHGR